MTDKHKVIFGYVDEALENKKKTGMRYKINNIWFDNFDKNKVMKLGDNVIVHYEVVKNVKDGVEKSFNKVVSIDIIDPNPEAATQSMLEVKNSPNSYDYFIEEFIGLATQPDAIKLKALLRIAYELKRFNDFNELK